MKSLGGIKIWWRGSQLGGIFLGVGEGVGQWADFWKPWWLALGRFLTRKRDMSLRVSTKSKELQQYKKICVKLNEFLPIVDKDLRGSRPKIHVHKDRYLCKHNLLHLLFQCFQPANRIKKLMLCSFWLSGKNKLN